MIRSMQWIFSGHPGCCPCPKRAGSGFFFIGAADNILKVTHFLVGCETCYLIGPIDIRFYLKAKLLLEMG
jgi:hypothetical protein